MFLFTEVKTPSDIRDFHLVQHIINHHDPLWIQPLERDVEAVFDRNKNKTYRHGDAIRWVVKNESGELTGRMAAFYNRKTARAHGQPTGGMGFFESINHRETAFAIFDRCREWLQLHGMEAMDGPVNFGERDRWWGLLVESQSQPNYCSNHNPLYYKDLFEAYGFRNYFEQYTYGMPVKMKLPEKYNEKALRVSKDPFYQFEHISKKYLRKYSRDFCTIYNKAWGKHIGVKTIHEEQAYGMMQNLRPVLDEDIVWFGYYRGNPVGFFIMIPEVNQIIRHLKGKMDFSGKMKFLWHKFRGTCRKMFGVVFGIVPEHQGKGVEGAIIMAAANHIQPMNRYDVFEMNWIGDFNPKMIHLCESLGAKVIKKHVTYRKLFEANALFERAPLIE